MRVQVTTWRSELTALGLDVLNTLGRLLAVVAPLLVIDLAFVRVR